MKLAIISFINYVYIIMKKISLDVVIIGAGAAGMMCAMQAGSRGRSVWLIDHAKSAGEKIRISGGGRCNFTNIHASPANYLSQNPHFCISALKRYTPSDFISLVKKHNITYHEKTLGQLFCDGSAKQIIAMLLQECCEAGVDLHLNTSAVAISHEDNKFNITLNDGQILCCESLVLASGGLSIPKMGATGFAYEVATQFGMKIIEPTPALVPFTADGEKLDALKSLAGVAFETIAKCGTTSFKEAALFTHRGLSGPAILQISSYWQQNLPIFLNMAPNHNVFELLKSAREVTPKQELGTILATIISKRLAQFLCEQIGASGRLADMSNATLQQMAEHLQNWQFIPDGTEGYRTAEVTLGGIDTQELSSQTMESKKLKGLFVIGEAVDVTGHLGGFNFQWAWASGYAAGSYC
jgi:predicted Rossmann fold flavoprotein